MKTGVFAFFLGILTLYQLPILPDSRWLVLAVPLSILLVFKPGLRLTIFFILGFFWALYRADIVLSQQLPQALEGQDLEIKGFVVGLPYQSSRRQQFLFDVDAIEFDEKVISTSYRFKLNWYDNFSEKQPAALRTHEIKPGDKWHLIVRVKRPNGYMNLGGRDYEASLFQQGVNATGYVKKGDKVESRPSSFMQGIHLWRGELYQVLQTSFPHLNGIIPALGLGIKDGLTTEVWNILRLTGTVHLIAISGLHIGLIAALSFFVGRWLWSLPLITLHWIPATKVAAVFAVIAAISYTAAAGFSIPTQRALIMVVTIMFCLLSNREMSRFDIFSISLLSVLVFSPASVISPGFWLSFTAVAIIFYTLSGRMNTKGIWQASFKVHFILALGLSPLLALFFGQNPLMGPLANIFAVPFFSLLITPLVLLGILLLSILKPMGEMVLKLTDRLIDSFWPFLEWVASLPYTSLQVNIFSIGIFIASLLGVVIILMPRGVPGRWLGTIFFLPVFLIQVPVPGINEYEFTLLDVGQGLSAVVRTNNHTLVYDTGAKYSAEFDTGKAVILPYLKAIGVKSLDKVIISHGDNDHAGGYKSLAEGIPITETLTSVPQKLQGENIYRCESGQNWEWDGVRFEILHPGKNYQSKENNRSCVLKVDNGHKSVLLTGDIEAAAESVLINDKAAMLDIDLLVAPHHGSKTSSTDEFLTAVSPEYVLFPVGYRNRFHHPAETIVLKYQKNDIIRLNSASDGAISFSIGESISTPDRFRQKHGHFWNRSNARNRVE